MKFLSLLLPFVGFLIPFLQSQNDCVLDFRANVMLTQSSELADSDTIAQSNAYLFYIREQHQTGFIDSSGNVVIAPRFEFAQEFSEGLCAVRVGGLFGFINLHGEMVIPPSFDYATMFQEGLALVFTDGNPFFIDKKGSVVIQPLYTEMSLFNNGRSYVRTHSGKQGVIDKNGKLMIDTVYKYIGEITNNLAVVQGLQHELHPSENELRKLEIGIVRTDGSMLIPFGIYEEITNVGEGYFKASLPPKRKGKDSQDVLLNAQGKIMFALPQNEYSWFDGRVTNGIIPVKFPIKRGKKELNGDYYTGYLNVEGKTIYDNTDAEYGNDFSEKRAFYMRRERGYRIIDAQGNLVSEQTFDQIAEGGFKNGIALVRTTQGWGVIDTTGQFIAEPRYQEIHWSGIVGNYFFFEEPAEDDTASARQNPRYGIADIYGHVIATPQFEYFDPRGFQHGLLKTWVNDRLTYFNKKGNIVWQEKNRIDDEPHAMNIDYMNRGYFYATSITNGHGRRGYYAEPEKISMFNSFPSAVLSVTADPEHRVELGKGVSGMMIYVANATADTMIFNAQDGRLYMKMQAKDKQGAWRDIEYLPSSWCGNSYHSIALADNHYWAFAAPVYEGSFYTKLRIQLTYVDLTDTASIKKNDGPMLDWRYRGCRELTIHSNEFDGSINPAQFWRRPEYHPAGIMDPYLE